MLSVLAGCHAPLAQKELLAPPKVDQRVELLSIVFRLADSEEYSSRRFPKYAESIEQHFGQHKDHAIIPYIQDTLRNIRGVGYDAVMQMAISLSDTYPFSPIIDFATDMPDARWNGTSGARFLTLLNEFYIDADCQAFFDSNRELYSTASSRFMKVYEELDLKWYETFYGEAPKDEFRIINGLGNGGGNYGPRISVNGKEIVYAVMGTWSVDSAGMPQYAVDDYFPTLLHEFNHSFVNHIVEKYHADLAPSGEALFEPVREQMNQQAYDSWQTMFAESVVRAGVVKYLKDHKYADNLIHEEMNNQIERSFWWTRLLVNQLEEYDQNRAKYPTLESYMPEIVRFFDKMAADASR